MKIIYLTHSDRNGAGPRYRAYNYEKYFLERGHNVDYSSFLYNDYYKHKYEKKNKIYIGIRVLLDFFKRYYYLKANIKKYDFIIISKEVFRGFPYFIDKSILKNKKYIIDLDDNPLSIYKNSSWRRMIAKNKVERLIEDSYFLAVGNHWYSKEFNEVKTYYLPTVLDIQKYNIKSKYTNELKIVWIGSPSTEKYLEILREPLKKLKEKYEFSFRVIGGRFYDENLKIENIKWKEDEETKRIEEADIGVMPLYDTYWEKGKCGFKLIQYMACGLPVVASPAPANEEIVEQGKNGYIAKTKEEWYQYLEKLILDIELRKKMGISGRKKIEENYSYQVWGPKYVNFLENILKN